MTSQTAHPRPHPTRPHAAGRAGITLIEILVSLGVLAVGLVGVATMLPLALHQSREGVMEDRKAAAGRRAFREFQVRGMANPENWVGDLGIIPDQRGTHHVERAAYCLDPLGVAAATVDRSLAASVAYFPADAAAASVPVMARISLSAQPGRGTLAAFRNGNLTPVPMSLWQAEEVFTQQDDLIFTAPEEDVLPPAQDWLANGDVVVKRMSEGRYSWFATLLPDAAAANDPLQDLYHLSIVVTAERRPVVDIPAELRYVAEGASSSDPGQIAPVTVDFGGAELDRSDGILGVAYGGGDVTLKSPLPIRPRLGQWLMLSQSWQQRVGDRTMTQFDFRWYRVVASDSADERDPQDSSYRLPVTLRGADWQIRGPAWAVLVPRVVAVYEKTIRLESSSLWTRTE
jgi:Tfp pilus assembly protein PilV